MPELIPPPGAMKCPRCGARRRALAFCPGCGTPLWELSPDALASARAAMEAEGAEALRREADRRRHR